MAAARKSAISATGNWFQRNASPLGKKRSLNRQAASSLSTPAVEPAPVSLKRQRRSSKNLSAATNRSVIPSGKQKSINLKADSTNLPVMNSSGTLPVWLLRFHSLHRYSSGLTFLLVAISLVVYGWTVYSQELWSQGYRRLQSLQRQERQLTTTNATLSNKMAQEAEKPAAGLALPTPDRTIFLPPASYTSNSTAPTTTPDSEQQQSTSPLGY
jgi:hypothetical protein